jgi:tetratricopeptide (TPR) repeat protein
MRGQLFPSGQMPSQEVLDYRPSPDALKKSEASLAEASQCFNRAMALAPKESEMFIERAGFLSRSNFQSCFFRHFSDSEKNDPTVWILANFSEESIANLQRAAELSPQNYEYISLAAYFEWTRAMTEWSKANSQAYLKRFTPDVLPDATRQSILDAMTRLETLSQSADKKLAAGALENLGMLKMFLGNSKAATANFRQAVSLDPTREQSWDMWLASITDSGTPEEKVAICESRLKYKDSARNHLLLARALQHQEKWDKVGEQTEAALKLEPDNVVAELELLALDLKQSADPNFMSKAAERFNRIDAVYNKLPDSKEKLSRWRELTLNRAILDGLEDMPEYQKAAKACLEAVLERFPNDETAKKISSALD